jgi:5-methylcytosine-specific restriction enzyme A
MALLPRKHCPHHRDCHGQHAREARRQFDLRRGSSSARGYGVLWQRLRKVVLQEEPLCRPCVAEGLVTAATEVDHHVALAKGGTNDRSNLVPMCKTHHSQKTAREDRG